MWPMGPFFGNLSKYAVFIWLKSCKTINKWNASANAIWLQFGQYHESCICNDYFLDFWESYFTCYSHRLVAFNCIFDDLCVNKKLISPPMNSLERYVIRQSSIPKVTKKLHTDFFFIFFIDQAGTYQDRFIKFCANVTSNFFNIFNHFPNHIITVLHFSQYFI